jgi:hypothetical protein
LFSKNADINMKKKITILCLFILGSISLQAAIPIRSQQASSQFIPQKTSSNQILLPGYGGNPHNEDKGIFGILALIFAVTGIFPLAIASGIIGTQNGRKFKGLAKAGLLFGILVGFVFVCYLFYIFYVL